MGLCYHRLVWGLEKRGSWPESASCQDNKPEEAGEAEAVGRACSPTQWSSAWGAAGEPCLSIAACCSLQATVKLQLVFLTDGKCNKPIYRGRLGVAITPVINLQQDSNNLLHTALYKTAI